MKTNSNITKRLVNDIHYLELQDEEYVDSTIKIHTSGRIKKPVVKIVSLMAKQFYRAIGYLSYKIVNRNIREEPEYYQSIKNMVATLKLQELPIHILRNKEQEEGLEQELFRQIKSIAGDASATGTYYFSVPLVHNYSENTPTQFSLNILYNKEGASLNLHSVVIKMGNIQDRFVPDQSQILHAPFAIRPIS
jgi:hypothetical protein